MAKAIVHFEIFASDVERAKRFYESVFDWKIEQWQGQNYWVVYTGRGSYPDGQKVGIDGGLLPRQGAEPFQAAPANAYVCTVEVDDIEAARHAVQAAGGHVVSDDNDMGGMMLTCYCLDTEGNRFGLMQMLKPAQ